MIYTIAKIDGRTFMVKKKHGEVKESHNINVYCYVLME